MPAPVTAPRGGVAEWARPHRTPANATSPATGTKNRPSALTKLIARQPPTTAHTQNHRHAPRCARRTGPTWLTKTSTNECTGRNEIALVRADRVARGGRGVPPLGGSPIEFGVTILPDPPCSRFVELVRLSEDCGFDWAYTYDSHILWQEGCVLVTAAAVQTERI